MHTSGFLLLFCLASLVYGLCTYSRAKQKTKDATQTALYIVIYPILITIVMSNKPVEPWIAVPVVMAGIPWLFAGAHLNQVVKDPSITNPRNFAGVPIKLWLIGAIVSVIIGVICK